MLRPVLPMFEYAINQDYIIEFLCINQDRPELQCEGKCYLMQMLAEQNEEKEQNLPRIAMEDYPIGFVSFIGVGLTKNEKAINLVHIDYCNHYRFIYSDTNFHPPAFHS